MRVLVTGGAGFIGSEVCRQFVLEKRHEVLNVDKLTYAANLASLAAVEGRANYQFLRLDICDEAGLEKIFSEFSPDAVVHLAAESHVDRSITGPKSFVETNIVGTFSLLTAALRHWQALPSERKDKFRFLHVSTDEVFGSLGEEGFFTETTPYDPRSPYSASKAASDHLVNAWVTHTACQS